MSKKSEEISSFIKKWQKKNEVDFKGLVDYLDSHWVYLVNALNEDGLINFWAREIEGDSDYWVEARTNIKLNGEEYTVILQHEMSPNWDTIKEVVDDLMMFEKHAMELKNKYK